MTASKSKLYNQRYREKHRESYNARLREYQRKKRRQEGILERTLLSDEERRIKRNAYAAAYQKRNRLKVNARNLLRSYVNKGKILRPDKCSRCFSSCKPEADHEDYTKPLKVTWLCHLCHVSITKQRAGWA